MVFSDTSSAKAGLIQDCEFNAFGDNSYGKISDSPERLATFTRLLNRAYDDAVSLIMEVDNKWQWDDNNNTDLPIATTNLVSGQQDYTLDATHLRILRVEAKDSAGNWVILKPIDLRDITRGTEEYFENDSNPYQYDKQGNSLILYPAPNFNSTAGLKVFYQRGPNYFTTADTTKAAGIVSLYHRFLSLRACEMYSGPLTITNLSWIQGEVSNERTKIREFYRGRSKDEQLRLRAVRSVNAR